MNKRNGHYLILALTLLAMTLFAGSASATPVLNPGNGHYYDIISDGSWNWAEASTDAQGRSYNGFQGHLVAITSQQENDFLRDDMAVPTNSWIGAFQPSGSTEPAGGWSWVTGEAWNFTSWGAGEPNNSGGEGCGHWWSPDGVWNDIRCTNSYGSYVIEYEDEIATSLTTFAVTKTFSDGNTDSVDVTLTCTSGLPLEQTFTISDGNPVMFVLTNVDAAVTNCTVTETGHAGGYTPSFIPGGDSASSGGADGCAYTNVAPGDSNTCRIFNTADDAAFTVNKVWNVFNEGGGDEVTQVARVTIGCDSEISNDGAWFDKFGRYYLSADLGDGDSLTAMVNTLKEPASCWAWEVLNQSGVESSDNCGTRSIPAGGSSSCTFTNTVFFEGIPTLSQYGLALMALLMLGMGMVGFRRFA